MSRIKSVTELIDIYQKVNVPIYEIFESVRDVEAEFGANAALKEVYFRYFTIIDEVKTVDENIGMKEMVANKKVANALTFLMMICQFVQPPSIEDFKTITEYPKQHINAIGLQLLANVMLSIALSRLEE